MNDEVRVRFPQIEGVICIEQFVLLSDTVPEIESPYQLQCVLTIGKESSIVCMRSNALTDPIIVTGIKLYDSDDVELVQYLVDLLLFQCAQVFDLLKRLSTPLCRIVHGEKSDKGIFPDRMTGYSSTKLKNDKAKAHDTGVCRVVGFM